MQWCKPFCVKKMTSQTQDMAIKTCPQRHCHTNKRNTNCHSYFGWSAKTIITVKGKIKSCGSIGSSSWTRDMCTSDATPDQRITHESITTELYTYFPLNADKKPNEVSISFRRWCEIFSRLKESIVNSCVLDSMNSLQVVQTELNN